METYILMRKGVLQLHRISRSKRLKVPPLATWIFARLMLLWPYLDLVLKQIWNVTLALEMLVFLKAQLEIYGENRLSDSDHNY